jgi:hypothetical protein
MKKKIMPFLSAAVLFLALASCAHYAVMSDFKRESAAPLPRVWLIAAVDLDLRVPDPATEKKLPEILSLLAARYGVTVVTDKQFLKPGEPYAVCRLWIREQPFTLSLDQYNSITGLLTLSSPDTPAVLARAVYSEETEESIRSFRRLYLVLDELFKSTAPAVGR